MVKKDDIPDNLKSEYDTLYTQRYKNKTELVNRSKEFKEWTVNMAPASTSKVKTSKAKNVAIVEEPYTDVR